MNFRSRLAVTLAIAATAMPVAPQVPSAAQSIQVEFLNSTYRVAPSGTSGSFRTGQDADIMLSGIDFNRTGGGLLFNHPGGIGSDGTRLLLADRNNNRVLIWNTPPGPGQEPDIVLGQKDFDSNNPGTGLDQLNWPSAVSAAPNGGLAVADTYNDRILLWNRFPTRSATPADIEIRLANIPSGAVTPSGAPLGYAWPWGVWTDGVRLAVTATAGAAILFWNQFPVSADRHPDFVIADPAFGTPRAITSDGNYLIVDDHNPRFPGAPSEPAILQHTGTFFWRTFPKSAADRYDFGIAGPRLRGGTVDGKLVLLGGGSMEVWDHFPASETDTAQLAVPGPWSSDGDGLAVAGGTMYTFDQNWNSIWAYGRVPDRVEAQPDFVIGAPDAQTNTLRTNFFMTNPVPNSDGRSLFVSSDFDGKLYVWKHLPDESGALPDVVYSFPEGSGWANARYGDTFVLAGKQIVYIWNRLPLNGELPDRVLRGPIGDVRITEARGVALDDRYFYLSDYALGKIFIWRGIPDQDSAPVAEISVGPEAGRISSDGRYLAVPVGAAPASIHLYDTDRLPLNTEPVAVIRQEGLNLPGGVLLADGKLFVTDTVSNRTLIWSQIDSAIAGRAPDIILGAAGLDRTPEIGRNKQFWPAAASFDGSYLWIGEFKFSGRLLRYSPMPPPGVSERAFTIPDRGGISLTGSGGAGPVLTGYARVQSSSGMAAAGMAILSFRQNNVLVSEVSVPAAAAITSGRIYAEISGGINAGLAMANPNDTPAAINFYFTDAAGNPAGAGTTSIPARQQIAQFLDQAPFKVYTTGTFQGTFTFTSSVPVAVVAIRGFTNERAEFLMTILPVSDLSAAAVIDSVVFPHFADGGGYTTQFLIVNPADVTLSGSLQFYDTGSTTAPGQPMTLIVNGETANSFVYSIAPRSAKKFRTSGTGALRTGSARLIPAAGQRAPDGLAIFTFNNAGVAVSDTGVPALRSGAAFRLYAEYTGNFAQGQAGSAQTGIAIANAGAGPATVNFELHTLAGTSTGLVGTKIVPANGQVSMFLKDIPGFAGLAGPFQGVLRISTASPAGISVIGLRGRINERMDFLMTTTQPVNETQPVGAKEQFIPQLAAGGGYTVQFILFSATAGPVASGNLMLSRQDGSPFLISLSGESGAPSSVPFNELVDRLFKGQLSESDKEALRRLVGDLKSGRVPGPWFDEVRLATSTDGLNFTDTRRTVVRKASVPEAVVDAAGNVWLFYVDVDLDKLLRAIDEGTPMRTGLIGIGGLGAARSANGIDFEATPMEIENVVAGEVVDPDIVVAADGTYQLYYLGVPALELDAQSPAPNVPGSHRFYLAESRDLIHWEQKGVAWTGPHGGADPAVYRVNDTTYFIIAGGTGRSQDGGRTFQPFNMTTGSWGQPDVVAVSGGFRAFHAGMDGVRSSFSPDGVNWREEEGVRLPGGNDPTVVRLKNGTYHLYYKVANTQPTQAIQVEFVNSTYRVAPGGTSGSFRTGQNADIMLSGIDFNRTGGGLLFDHPGGIGTDGTRLLLADRNNNRVLVWNTPPGPGQEPDIVLGQMDFNSNDSGTGRNQLNWPSAVSAGSNGRLAVADTNNDRILLWNSFPARSGTPADIEISLTKVTLPEATQQYGWPWGVWTDGVRLVATATHGRAILFWNKFPAVDDQRPDYVLSDPAFGTPRAITSDGNYLIVDDHNMTLPSAGTASESGTFFWKAFPKSSADRYDFGIAGPRRRGGTVDGKLVLLAWQAMEIWDHFPANENDKPQVTVTGPWSSDGQGIAVAGGTIYTFDYNWNSIWAFRSLPVNPTLGPPLFGGHPSALPDFVIGAPDALTNTLTSRFFITSPAPASDGHSLFASSGFDRKLYVWRKLPDESGALPDVVYSFPEEVLANVLHGGVLVLAGKQTLYVWNRLPLNGELPDRTLSGAIGGVQMGELRRVALDDQYFYVADEALGKVYVWRGIPQQNDTPVAEISTGSVINGHISSDGRYLAVPVSGTPPVFLHSVHLYDIGRLPSNTSPAVIITRPRLNGAGGALLAGGKLFVMDTGFSKTLVWSQVESALAGRDPDIILGATSFDENRAEIGRDKQFWPAAASFDGSYLWVGEVKFSHRLLRYSPTP